MGENRPRTGSVSVRLFAVAVVFALAVPASFAGEPAVPAHLPRYDLDITLDTAAHRATIRDRVTWTNPTHKPVTNLVFNFYPHYRVPEGEYVLFAKTLEMLRMQPSLGIDRSGRAGVVKEATLHAVGGKPLPEPAPLDFDFDPANSTVLRFPLPQPVGPGESVTVELVCELHLPNKQGRLGHWNGVTFLTNSLPVLAFCDDSGWRPMPFVPWHQPWFNEAGVFTAKVTLPEPEVLAVPAVVKSETPLGDGRKRVETEPFVGRDFAVLSSARYKRFTSETKLPDGKTVALHCLAFPEHEFYATEILKIVGEAIPVYSQWFGSFPYQQFTIVESYFGWNGNECAGLIMIDERVFGMPHLARGYVEYLVSHETCHQWWYNLVGTNGYAEPFMDEGAATYFTHRLLDTKNGKNNAFMDWPEGLKWLPNIKRENYRYGGMYLSIRNNEMHPAAQPLPEYGTLFGLFTGAYDRGSKVFGMIEDRLGEAAFLDFIRGEVEKCSWRVLRVCDFKHDLEAYTGRDWTEFFDRWVFGKGLTDWSVESVKVDGDSPAKARLPVTPVAGVKYNTSVIVRQRGEYTEPTVIGFTSASGSNTIRVPVLPAESSVQLDELGAKITPLGEGKWRVDVALPFEPEQVTIDPDHVLLDANPGNNTWKPEWSFRATPLYTTLDETDLTANYDRCNFVAGPWVWGQAYPDPWYTRSTMAGLRVGAYRTERYRAGAYAAYRTDYRDAVLGADAAWLGEKQEIGINWEHRIGGPWGGQEGSSAPQRAVVYHRNIWKQGSSMYLPPIMYDDIFLTYQDNFLPFTRTPSPGAERPIRSWLGGWHYRLNMYTPYWDPESGFWVDLTAAVGETQLSTGWEGAGQFRAELAGVKQLPDWLGGTRIAGRMVSMGGLPDQAQFFALGGGTLFRGYDLAQRQGSLLWVGNVELRVPVARNLNWDVLDHCAGARNVWLTGFYDVGDVYANGRSVGGRVAHAVGGGVRVDVAVFSFIERATLRFDFGKTLNDNTPFQFWFGIQQAF